MIVALLYRVDDIEDNSILRRGIPVAHSIYGVASTINAANYVYFLGLEKCLALNHPQATQVFCEQLLELHRGQGMEIYWRDSYICPTEDEYKEMIIKSETLEPLHRIRGSDWLLDGNIRWNRGLFGLERPHRG